MRDDSFDTALSVLGLTRAIVVYVVPVLIGIGGLVAFSKGQYLAAGVVLVAGIFGVLGGYISCEIGRAVFVMSGAKGTGRVAVASAEKICSFCGKAKATDDHNGFPICGNCSTLGG